MAKKSKIPGITVSDYTMPAPFWKRILALMIDLFVIEIFFASFFRKAMLEMIPESLSVTQVMELLKTDPTIKAHLLTTFTIIALIGWLYFTLLEWKVGQTIGKMIVNIHVVAEEKGKNLGLFSCMLRNVFLIPIFPFIILWVIDPIYMFLNPNQQRLTEQLSRTRVVG